MNFSKSIQMKMASTFLSLLFLSVFSVSSQDAPPAVPEPASGQAVYELRIYYPHDGKLDDLLARFRNHTTGLFEKHGFTNVGYWVTRPGENKSYATHLMAENGGKEALLYIVSFPDMETRNASWEAFVNDPEWKKVYEESRVNGPLVEEIHQAYMNPTDFSKLK